MTNFMETKQTQSKCEEDYEAVDCICQSADDCKIDIPENNWNGV